MCHGVRGWGIVGKGFTLVELMVVLAIIALMAALAVPIYKDYVNSTQVRTLYAEVSAYKTVVEERIADGNSAISNDDLGFNTPRFAQPAMSFVSFRSDGTVSLAVLMGGQANPSLSGVSVSIVRNVSGNWRCAIDGASASGWRDSYKPTDC